jgi:hypothetical protein
MRTIIPFKSSQHRQNGSHNVLLLKLRSYLLWALKYLQQDSSYYVRFEGFTAVNMKNVVFWDVTLVGSCKNRQE